MDLSLIVSLVALLLAAVAIIKKSGGILTGHEISRQVRKGRIEISDFDPSRLNPNSYNVSVGDTVMIYTDVTRFDLDDPDTFSSTETIKIGEDGFTLRPGIVYLIPIKERIGSDFYEFIITGRSSFGRLGNSVHEEAGFGDIGYHGNLTMQIKVTYPTKIKQGQVIAQIYFLTPCGKINQLYHGKYQESSGPISCKSFFGKS